MSEAFLTPFIASDGDILAVMDWPLSQGNVPRATVLIVHGLGEHAGRYAALAHDLNQWGYQVRSYDQYGHGESGGLRGDLPHGERLLDDLAEVVDGTRRNMGEHEALILLGHSMGGVVAAQFAMRRIRPVEGLVMSSPALNPGLNALQKALLKFLPRIAPHLRLGNGLKLPYLCRDPAIVAAYRSDPLVHDRVSAILAHYVSQAGAQCMAAAAQWRTPTLLMYAGADRLVSPTGSQAFAADAPIALVQTQCFDQMYHEILNDPQNDQVLTTLQSWLAALPSVTKPV
jgi:alpha-beta hydrolase superfamily lysophospholipase